MFMLWNKESGDSHDTAHCHVFLKESKNQETAIFKLYFNKIIQLVTKSLENKCRFALGGVARCFARNKFRMFPKIVLFLLGFHVDVLFKEKFKVWDFFPKKWKKLS